MRGHRGTPAGPRVLASAFVASAVAVFPLDASAQDAGTGNAATRVDGGDPAFAACVSTLEESVVVTAEAGTGLFQAADGRMFAPVDLAEGEQGGEFHSTGTATAPETGTFSAVPLGPPDRWELVPAWIVTGTAAAPRLWQADVLAAGAAVFAPRLASGACAGALRAAEAEARAVARGVWADKASDPMFFAGDPGSFLGAEGRYVIVRGRVVSLGKTRETRYLNFGKYWKTDVTGTLPTAGEAEFAARIGNAPERATAPADNADAPVDAGTSDGDDVLGALAGRWVELRGIVEDRDGPHVALRHPEQLVVLDD